MKAAARLLLLAAPLVSGFSTESIASVELYSRISAEQSRELAEIWPNITEKKEPPADAEDWEGKPNKLALLER